MSENSTINVLFVASEASPFIKVGGLGDVAGSLPPALQKLSPSQLNDKKIDIRMVIPFHSLIKINLQEIQLVATFSVPHSSGDIPARAYKTIVNDLTVYLIEGSNFSSDQSVYSSDTYSDGQKYIFFSLAVLEFVKAINWHIDILHANDWHTALSIYELNNRRHKDKFFERTKSIITVHNLPYMGGDASTLMQEFGIKACNCPSLPVWARNFPLPLGLFAADYIVTVSPNYAREILTPEFGCGLQEFLLSRKNTVTGILNGLDELFWNPASDKAIHKPYDLNSLTRRSDNKSLLQQEFDLILNERIPLFILISRMDPQKGIDIAIEGMRIASDLPWQVIFLGTGDPLIEAECRSLEAEFPDRVRALIRFDLKLSSRMYSGGDFILIPSRYEPCGLTQMIGMRYGCIPIARSTGGLKDTIRDLPDSEDNTGLLFSAANPLAFAQTINRAVELFTHKDRVSNMQMNGMKANFSWDKSALEYANIYLEILGEND